MDANERKAELKKIMANPANISRTGIPIIYHGDRRTFNAYKIPLAYLVYNTSNGRIGSFVKSYERHNRPLNPENSSDKALIEKFLWESKPEANKATMKRLIDEGQQLQGIVTADGVIVDGNRRASLLNKITNDPNIDFNTRSSCQFFVAVILPEDADRRELLALETTYQMGEDAKLDYNPIEKYLKCKDLSSENFDDNAIAKFMGVTVGKVKEMKETMVLMDDYLDTYGYSGMYTLLGKGEDAFLTLRKAINKYKSGVPSMWDYDVRSDISDLKQIAFDYIRLGFEKHPFRSIVLPPSAKNSVPSFFSQKRIWEEFRDQHFNTVSSVQETSVEDIIHTEPADLSEALKARDRDWAEQVGEALRANHSSGLDELDNERSKKEPLKLLKKACNTLDTVDTAQPDFTNNPEIAIRVSQLHRKIIQFKKILGI